MSESTDSVMRSGVLGEVVREYRPRPWWIGLLVGIVLIGILVPVTLEVKAKDNKSSLIGPLAIGTAIVGGATAYCAVLFLMSLRGRLIVHRNGVRVAGLMGSSETLWNDIDCVYFHMSKSILGKEAWFTTLQSKKVKLPKTIVGLFDAYTTICEAIEPRVTDSIRSAIDGGGSIAFGKDLELQREGLLWKGGLLRWADIKKLRFVADNYSKSNNMAVRSILGVEGAMIHEQLLCKDVFNIPILLDYAQKTHGIEIERIDKFFG